MVKKILHLIDGKEYDVKFGKFNVRFENKKEGITRIIFLPSKDVFAKEFKSKISIEDWDYGAYNLKSDELIANIEVSFKPENIHIDIIDTKNKNSLPIEALGDGFVIGRELSKKFECEMIDPHTLVCRSSIKGFDLTIKRDEGFVAIEKKNGNMFWI